eukprot:sb/3465233/
MPNNTLAIPNTMVTDSGVYTCTAQNSVGTDTNSVILTVKAIDGGFSDWAQWSNCSVACGQGTRTRTRTCTEPAPSTSGKECVGAKVERAECSNMPCPVHGKYTSWTDWTPCDKECGLGQRSRTKTCTNPKPAHGGRNCTGGDKVTETDACFEANCPVNGGWSRWSSWTQCSEVCDGGTQTRSRSCTNPVPMFNGTKCGLDDPETEMRACNEEIDCPEHPIVFGMLDQEVDVGEEVEFVCRIHALPRPSVLWMRDSLEVINTDDTDPGALIEKIPISISEGDTITLNCVSRDIPTWKLDHVILRANARYKFEGNDMVITDQATQYVSGTYTCLDGDGETPRKTYQVTITPVNGGLGQWTGWSSCLGNGCGMGTKSRVRECDSPAPSVNGKKCEEADLKQVLVSGIMLPW